MIFPLFISLVLPILTGIIFCVLLWPKFFPLTGSHFLIIVWIGSGLGIGIFSIIFFLSLIVFGYEKISFILIEGILLFSLILILSLKFKLADLGKFSSLITSPFSNRKTLRFLAISFYIAFGLSIIIFILLLLNRPHGEWDAWAIWNMRARFLYRGKEQWMLAFSNLLGWSHPDYPVLIPGFIACCWEMIGHETQIIPSLVAMLFTYGTVGLMFSALSSMGNRLNAYLGGLILVGTPFFITHGASQYADIPLGFFFLATIVLLGLQDTCAIHNVSIGKFNFLILAGITAGLASWTKNEGLAFCLSILTSRFFLFLSSKGWINSLKEILSLGLGLGPTLGLFVYFKFRLAPDNDIFASPHWSVIIDRITDLSRFHQIMKAFVEEILNFGNWAFNIPALIILILFLLLLGRQMEKNRWRSVFVSLSALGMMLAIYFSIFLISPHNLQWHLSTSLNRLMLHLWPWFIFTFLLMVIPQSKHE